MTQHEFSAFGPQNLPVESIGICGVVTKVGDRVRLWPKQGADIMDLALRGKLAVIEALERDFDDKIHVAVVLEDDPGRDLGMLRQPGHRFFFAPEEIEPLALTHATDAAPDLTRSTGEVAYEP
jgi:hypothetical protein